MNSKESTPKRRPITAVRRSKIVRESIIEMGLDVDQPIGMLVEAVRDAALVEVENQ